MNSIFALAESLRLVKQEGLERAWERHREISQTLVTGLDRLGLEMMVDDTSIRLPQLSVVNVPQGIDEAAVRSRLLQDEGIEIGAGLGPLAGKVWRIGLMGHSCRSENVERLIGCLRAGVDGPAQGRFLLRLSLVTLPGAPSGAPAVCISSPVSR